MIKKRGIILLLFLSCYIFHINGQDVAIKSNLAADLTTTINLGTEIGLTPKTTLDLYANYNPWSLGNHKQFKHFLFQPEYRYWFCERFNRHFIGAHLHGAIYNAGKIKLPFGLGDDNFRVNRYKGWLAGGGISYGYHWILNKRWSLEANIGVGYAFLKYDKYRLCEDCKELKGNETKHYIGPTKAALTIIYMIK